MSEEQHDPLEYAKLLGECADLGRTDMSEPRPSEGTNGLSRRELLKRGPVGAAAVSG